MNQLREYHPELLSRTGEFIAWLSTVFVFAGWIILVISKKPVTRAIPFLGIFLLVCAIGISLGNWMDRRTSLQILSDGIHFGQSIGGSNATAYGLFLGAGVAITTGVTNNTAPGLRVTNFGGVILQNGVTVGDLSLGTTLYDAGETLLGFEFVGSGGGGSAGFTGIRGTTRTLGT